MLATPAACRQVSCASLCLTFASRKSFCVPDSSSFLHPTHFRPEMAYTSALECCCDVMEGRAHAARNPAMF
jgi:hypothetical protein